MVPPFWQGEAQGIALRVPSSDQQTNSIPYQGADFKILMLLIITGPRRNAPWPPVIFVFGLVWTAGWEVSSPVRHTCPVAPSRSYCLAKIYPNQAHWFFGLGSADTDNSQPQHRHNQVKKTDIQAGDLE